MCDIWKVFNQQSLSFICDVWLNRVLYPYIALVTNSPLHSHYTRTCTNLHISTVSTLNKHNFSYNSTLFWSKCPLGLCSLLKYIFLSKYKVLTKF